MNKRTKRNNKNSTRRPSYRTALAHVLLGSVRCNGRVVIGWKLMRANDPLYGHNDNEIEQCFSVSIYVYTYTYAR